MKYLITERQFRLLNEEDTEEPVVPKKIKVIHYEFFDNNWDKLQNYLNRNEIRKKTPYILVGDVNLRGVDVVTLGSLVGVDGSLDLRDSDIESLGNLKSVEGDLRMTNSFVESLENLETVGESLYLKNSYVLTLSNLKSVGGNLDCRNYVLESLGNLESVGGFLFVEETNIESLGNLKFVGYDFDLRFTPLSRKTTEEEIRSQVDVGRDIYF